MLRNSALRKLARFANIYFVGALHALWLFTFGILNDRNRDLIYRICLHFGFEKRRPLLPKVEPAELVSNAGAVQLFELSAKDGNVSVLELLVLSLLVRAAKATTLFEIGTFDGRTTLNLAANSPGGTVLTLDLPPNQAEQTKLKLDLADVDFVVKPESGARFKGRLEAKQIRQLWGDSATFDFSSYHGTCDFVFVDGSHSYPYIKNDAVIALRLLRPQGGTIVFHDYDALWPGVTQALNELYTADTRFNGLRHVAGTSLVVMKIQP